MPPPGHEPLLNAIRAQPDDDVLRLAYADWLEENDDPERAAFVRVQCRLAALGHGPLWPTPGTHPPLALGGLTAEAAALTRRQVELWAENGEEWLAELPELPGCTILFHRGFASSVVAQDNPAGLVRGGRRLLELAPVTQVTFRNCRPEAVEVTVLRPWFAGVRGLTVSWWGYPAGDEVAGLLGAAEHLTELRDLSLFAAGLTDAGAEELANAPFTRRLTRLDLASNRVGGTGAWAVALALDPARVTVLDLSGNPIPARRGRPSASGSATASPSARTPTRADRHVRAPPGIALPVAVAVGVGRAVPDSAGVASGTARPTRPTCYTHPSAALRDD